MNTSTLTELIEGSRLDICDAKCKFDPEKVMEKIIKAGDLIRVLDVSNRVSINVESTSQSRVGELSSVKDLKNDIMRRERWICREVEKFRKRG